MAHTLLIADDEHDIVSLIKEGFLDEGFTVLTAYNGYQAIEMAKQQPDLILLDVMMPGLDGYEVCQGIRQIVNCPIVFLSARHAETDRILGLSVGGDDYLIKPFSLKELKARVNAHLRREARSRETAESFQLRFGTIVISLNNREVSCNQQPISMTPKEFDIIRLLATHPGQVFSKEQIYDKIWGLEATGDMSTVAEHIKNIRAKLSSHGSGAQWISTVWGVGYKWNRLNS
jgi:two-component system, OmpR family, lantibiotic biosynthesis response regulator NisR/SpaR